MKMYEQLLLANKAWAREKTAEDPMFFERLAGIQTPGYLWIGCSDSRVPPDQITQTQPGELFIHRNIANLVVPSDANLLSVVQYAVEVLNVPHVILCGHYGCGGVKAAMGATPPGVIHEWLNHLRTVYRRYKTEISALEREEDRVNRLVEHNVREQLLNLARTDIIQQAWRTRGDLQLHGWIYDLHDGVIKPIMELSASEAGELSRFQQAS